MSFRKFLLLPMLIRSGMRAPKSLQVAWDGYWRQIRGTGKHGDVLWDGASEAELRWCREQAERYMDRELPLVDFGAGNGRYARALAPSFPRVVGLDLSARAVELATADAQDEPKVSFRTADVTAPGLGKALHAELGDSNVFVRGVFHVLSKADTQAAVENIAAVLGERGVLVFLETAFPGSSLDYLESLIAEDGSLPAPLRLCIESGLPPPHHFGRDEFHRFFPGSRWDQLGEGPVEVHAVPMRPQQEMQVIPGFFAAVRRVHAS